MKVKQTGRRLPRRVLSAALASILLLTPVIVHYVPALADEKTADTGNFTFEAEDRVNTAPGAIGESGGVKYVEMAAATGGNATYGNSFAISKGRYTVTARMQQIGGDYANKDSPFGFFSILDKEGRPLYMLSLHNSMFAQQNVWTDVDFTIDVPQDLDGVQICMNSHGNGVAAFRLDKYTFTRLADDAPLVLRPWHINSGQGTENFGRRTENGIEFTPDMGGGGLWAGNEFRYQLGAGNYKLRAYLKQENPPAADQTAAALLAQYNDGTANRVLDFVYFKQEELKTDGAYKYVELPLSVPDNTVWRFHDLRFQYFANCNMIFERYEIVPEGGVAYEAEAGRQDPYQQVTDGDVTAVKADKGADGPGTLTKVTGVNLPKGRYKVSARLKMDPNTDGTPEGVRNPFGYMSVMNAAGDTVLFRQSVHLTQIALDAYKDVEFYINPDTDIENAQLWMSTHANVGSFLIDKFTVTRMPYDAPMILEPGHFANTVSVLGNINPNGIDLGAGMGEGASISGGNEFKTQLNAGSHTIRAYLKQFNGPSADPEKSIVSFAFTWEGGEAGPFLFKQKDIPAGGGLVPVEMALEVPAGQVYRNFDIHVTYHAGTDLTLNRFELTAAPFFVYEAEDRTGGNGAVVDVEGGKGLLMGITESGNMLNGSDFTLARGKYKITARMRIDAWNVAQNFFDAPFAYLLLNNYNGSVQTFVQSIHLNQMKGPGEWSEVDFYINPSETLSSVQLCINKHSNNVAGFTLDRFVVTKLADDAPLVLQPGHFSGRDVGSYTWAGIDCGPADGYMLYNGNECKLQLDEGSYGMKMYVNQITSPRAAEETPIFQVEFSYNDGADRTLAPIVIRQKDLVYPDPFDFETDFVPVNVPISVPKGAVFRNLQIKVKMLNATALRINRMEFHPSNTFVYEAENGNTVAGTAFDEDGVRGYRADWKTGGNILHGSNYSLKAGLYKVTARMMLTQPADFSPEAVNRPFGYFYISSNGGQTIHFMQSLHVNQFDGALDAWKDVVFYINPDRDLSGLEFCMNAHGNGVTSFKLDKLTVEQLPETETMIWQPGHFSKSETGNFVNEGIDAVPGMGEGVLLAAGNEFKAQLNSGRHDIKFFVSQTAKAAKDSDAVFSVQYKWKVNGADGGTETKTVVQTMMPDAVGTEEAVNLPLEVPAGQVYTNFDVEIRYYGKSPLRLSRVEVSPAQAGGGQQAVNETIWVKNSNADEGTRTVTDDGIQHKPAEHAAGVVSKGNYLSLPAGDYRAVVYTRLLERAANMTQVPLALQVYDRETGQPAVSRDITTRMIGSRGELKPVVVGFTLDAPLSFADIRLTGKDLLGFEVTRIDVYTVENGGIVEIEAEDASSVETAAGTAERTETGLLCDPATHNAGHFFSMSRDLAFDVRAGQNRVVARMRLLEKPPTPNENIANFDIGYINADGAYVAAFDHAIRGGVFSGKVGEYVDVVIPLNAAETYRSANIRIWNFDTTKFELDKVTYYDEAAWTAAFGQPEEEPIYAWECENMNSVTGINTGDGIICAEGMRADFAAYTDNFVMPAGNWKGVIYMKLIRKTGNPNAVVTTFDCFTTTGNRQSVTEIKESQFPETDVYYPIVVNFNNLDEINWHLRISYNGVGTVKYDKFIVLYPEMDIPEAVQEAPDTEKRPEGVPAHDSYEVPLTEENIRLSHDAAATIAGGTISFDNSVNMPGEVKGLNESIYMTTGKKIARFYLRPQDETGTFEFLRLTVMQGYLPLGARAFKGADFAGYVGKSFVVDIPIECNEDKAIDLQINWLGSKSLVVEKIVIKTEDDPDYVTHKLMLELDKDGCGTLSITPETMAAINPIDRVEIQAGDRKLLVLASDLFKWLEGNDSLDIVFGKPSAASAETMRGYAAAIGDDGATLGAFDLHFIQRNAETGDKTMTEGVFDIQLPIPADLYKDARWDHLFPVACNLTDAGSMEVLKPVVNGGREYVTISSTTFGSFHLELFDLTDTLFGPGGNGSGDPSNPDDPSGDPSDSETSPGTGVALPLAAAAVAGLAGLTAAAMRRRKSKSV